MVQTAPDRQKIAEDSAFRETYTRAYRCMLRARMLDDKFATLYRAGKIQGGVFLGRGQEALSVASAFFLRKGDIFAPLIRDAAGRLQFGETILDAARTFLGSSLGPMRGRDGNVHRGDPKRGELAMVSHLGAMISVVNGALMAHRFKKIKGTVGVASIGEGGTSTGSFHEALNQAAVEKLPLILIVANNGYAYSTPSSRQFACDSLADKASGYGVTGHTLDGTDLAECLKILGEAVANAREGGGPQLIVAKLLRLCGHGEHDDASYIDPKLRNSPSGRDCMKVCEEFMQKQNWLGAETIQGWRREAIEEIEQAVAKAQREPTPDPYSENWQAMSSKELSEGNE